MIHLAVGRLEIDWGKNSVFADHSQLSQPCVLAQVPYYYVDPDQPYKEDRGEDENNLVTEFKDGLSKPLHRILERIDLLGHTMKHALIVIYADLRGPRSPVKEERHNSKLALKERSW